MGLFYFFESMPKLVEIDSEKLSDTLLPKLMSGEVRVTV
jgi:hypothetical protein